LRKTLRSTPEYGRGYVAADEFVAPERSNSR
jgi:hypothetical protein